MSGNIKKRITIKLHRLYVGPSSTIMSEPYLPPYWLDLLKPLNKDMIIKDNNDALVKKHICI